MYGIVEIAGHQYKVNAGDLIDVELLKAEAGSNIKFDQVLFIGGEKAVIGKPVVAGASVEAKVIKHAKSRKVLIMKRVPGTYEKKNGHRQNYTSLLITGINDGSGKAAKIDAASKEAKKYLK